MRAIDCLGFAGGFTLGMVQAGFELVGKREMPGGFGVANCEANRHLLGHNWRAEVGDHAQWGVIDADAVFGNPPCSGFSGMSAKHFRGADSPINRCMWAFVDYVARVRPTIAVFESVQLAFTRPDGLELMRALRAHLEEKTNDQWTLTHVLHNAYSVGGCSQRRRYFWVVSRVPFGIEWEIPSRLPVLHDAIGDLHDQPEMWSSQSYVNASSWWATNRRRDDLQVDGHVSLRNPLVQRVADLMSTVEWRPGEHLAQVAMRYYETTGRLPPSWQSDSVRKFTENGWNMGYNTPVRWSYDQPARVITGAGLITALHPVHPRPMTHREVARIMGFPDDWRIEPLRHTPGLSATWGKGITVDCGRWIGHWIKAALDESPGSFTGTRVGDREFVVDFTYGWRQSLIQSDLTLKKYRKLLGGITVMTAPEIPTHEGEVTAVDESTASAVEESNTGKGRPRPQATIDLDARGLEAIKEAGENGHTKETLAVALGIKESLAYLVFYRLRVAGEIHKVRKDGKFVWVAGAPSEVEVNTGTETVPAEQPAEVPAI